MTDRSLVSVITPTWGRHDLLMEAIQNVRAQTYRPLEHVIVSDGPDTALLVKMRYLEIRCRGDVPIRFVELGRNWTSCLTDSYTAAPMIVAQLLATGEYHAFWADDERASPNYLSTMVDALERDGTDFAYPRVAYYRWDVPGYGVGIGSDPPKLGSITTMVYRASMLDTMKGPYRTHVGRANDWEFTQRAMKHGATWTFVDEVLFSHRDDRGCPPEKYAEPLPEFARVG